MLSLKAKRPDDTCDEAMEAKEERVLACGLCRKKEVTVRCLDCKRFLCADCRVSHNEIPACASHTVEDMDTYKERHVQSLHDIVEGYITIVCECEQNSRDLTRYTENIKVMKRQILEKIQDSAFQMHECVTKYHQSLVDVVHAATVDEHRAIERKLVQLQKTSSQVVGKTNIIKGVIESNDVKTLCDDTFVSEMKEDYGSDCPLYERKLAELKVPSTLLHMRFQYLEGFPEMLKEVKIIIEQAEPMENERGDTSSQSSLTDDSDDDDKFESLSITLDGSHQVPPDLSSHHDDPYPKKLSDAFDTQLAITKITAFDKEPKRISSVNNELWVIMGDGQVRVYSPQDGVLKRHIKIKEVDHDPPWWSRLLKENTDTFYDCIMVAECRKNVAMCLGKVKDNKKDVTGHETQIVQINNDGHVVNKMVSSNYIDVSCDNDVVYALLSGSPNKVDIFKSDGAEGSTYFHINTVTLESGRTYHRVLATAGVVYVTGLRHEVHRYHIETVHRYTHGIHGSNLAGELDTPKLCFVDDYGVLLLADSQNHRLQVLDREKQWHILELQSKVICPWDAAWLSRRGELWVLSSQGAVSGTNVLHKIVVPSRPQVLVTDNKE